MTISKRITFEQLIGCLHPIAIMAMNRVSDVKLAIAGAAAGVLPSLSVFNYYTGPGVCNAIKLNDALVSFNVATNNAPLLFSIDVSNILKDEIFACLIDNKIKVVELVLDDSSESTITDDRLALTAQRVNNLRSNGSIVFAKSLGLEDLPTIEVDGIILKGPTAAGRVLNGLSLLESIATIKAMHPELHIIASGGIGNSDQIQECLDAGAIGVGLGTIFAAAEECSISMETKLKMIEASANDITKLTGGAKQNALVFSELPNDVYNNTHGMAAGAKSPISGHIFAGSSIQYVNAIESVDQIVKRLASNLQH